MVVRDLPLGVTSISKRSANSSPLTKGPSTLALWTWLFSAHHLPLSSRALRPCMRAMSPASGDSRLTTVSDQYFFPASSNFPARHSSVKVRAISDVLMGASLGWSDEHCNHGATSGDGWRATSIREPA